MALSAHKTFARLISPAELEAWIIYEDEAMVVVDKPAGVVCHPSKAGPWSSLSGAVRELRRLGAAHLSFRLDRETSGLTVFAKTRDAAAVLQRAAEERRAAKSYLAVLTGELQGPVTVDQPLGPDTGSPVKAKTAVTPGGRRAVTTFEPLAAGGGFTLAGVRTVTGRKHQIRAHALWLGHPLVGDKIYGPDPGLFLEFVENGWTPELERELLLPRQALHCSGIDLSGISGRVFRSPLPADLRDFCSARGMKLPVEFP